MNRDPITVLLAVTLLVSAVATSGLCFWYLQSTRVYRAAQEGVARANRNRALLQSFVAEAAEYSKKNPAIVPVLQSFAARRDTNSPATPPQP